MGCCNNNSIINQTCCPLPMVGYGNTVSVSSVRHCISQLQNPVNPSLLLYDSNGQVVWKDGSSTFPICLPELQSGMSPAFLIGMTTQGCLVKIPVTYNDIVTCEGPTLTVATTAVT